MSIFGPVGRKVIVVVGGGVVHSVPLVIVDDATGAPAGTGPGVSRPAAVSTGLFAASEVHALKLRRLLVPVVRGTGIKAGLVVVIVVVVVERRKVFAPAVAGVCFAAVVGVAGQRRRRSIRSHIACSVGLLLLSGSVCEGCAGSAAFVAFAAFAFGVAFTVASAVER